MEHNRPRILDCDYYEQGYYAAFYDNGGTLLMCDNWVKCTEIRRVLSELLRINSAFAIQTERDKVGGVVAELTSFEVPFAINKRFDINNAYYRLNTGAYPAYLTQITSAASYKDRRLEKENKVAPSKPDDIATSWSYDDAATAYSKGLRGLMELVNGKSTAYDSYKFEKEFNMIWCCGPEKCPIPKPCQTCTMPNPPNNSSSKPAKPSNQTVISNNKFDSLKRAMKSNGLKIDKFFLDKDSVNMIPCNGGNKVRLTDLPNDYRFNVKKVILYSDDDITNCNMNKGVELWTYFVDHDLLEQELYTISSEEEFDTALALKSALSKWGLDANSFHVHIDNFEEPYCDLVEKDDLKLVSELDDDFKFESRVVLLYDVKFKQYCSERDSARLWTYEPKTGFLYKDVYELTKVD